MPTRWLLYAFDHFDVSAGVLIADVTRDANPVLDASVTARFDHATDARDRLNRFDAGVVEAALERARAGLPPQLVLASVTRTAVTTSRRGGPSSSGPRRRHGDASMK